MKFSAFRICALVGLTGLALVGFYSHAQPTAVMKSAPPVAVANNKVIIYPTADENIGQLKAKGIAKVTNYGSYWLVEATDAQVDELTRMYGAQAVKESRFNRIQLGVTSFDTTTGEPSVPADFRQKDEAAGKRLRLVQFRGPIIPEWMQLLESSGAQVISYVPNDAYLVQLDKAAEDKLCAERGADGPIQWIGAYHPYYRIQAGLLDTDGKGGESLVDVRVVLTGDSEVERAAHPLQKFGLIQGSYGRAREKVAQMTVPSSAIPRIAQLPDVLWIEKAEPKRLLDEVQDLVLAGQTNGLGNGPESSVTGITNYLDFLLTVVAGGMTNEFIDPNAYPVVDVADSGLDSGDVLTEVTIGTNRFFVIPPVHPAFHVFGEAVAPSRVTYWGPPWEGGDPLTSVFGCQTRINENAFRYIEAEDLYGHGTAVASVIAGFDAGTNILSQPCLELQTITKNYVVNLLNGYIDNCGHFAICPQSGSTNLTFCLSTGVTNVCGSDTVYTNITIAVTAGTCPCASSCTPFSTNILYTQVVTDYFSEIRTDASGFQYGMGVSPFGQIGVDRIWAQDVRPTTVGSSCQIAYYVDEPECFNNLPALMAIAYLGNNGEAMGARIQNNSWADDITITGSAGGRYTADSASYDIGVRDAVLTGASNNIPGPSPLNQELIVVFACASVWFDAGNQGNAGGFADIRVTAPATAKNVISVGAAENPRLDGSGYCLLGTGNSLDMAPFAAPGPTLDGRFKPEIVAPGDAVWGAVSQLVPAITNPANCNADALIPTFPYVTACTNPPCDNTQEPIYTQLYACRSGSSYSAAAVSGSIQLLWWYFQHRLTNEVGHALFQPSPAMAKAYLCNAARYLPISDPQYPNVMDTLPSILQGMGELDLATMFDGVTRVIRDESTPRAITVDKITTNPAPQQTYFSQSGQSYEVSGQIFSNGLPFRVTLAWTDAAGNPLVQTGPQLVNDLDLEVILGGVTYKGNVFAQNVSVPGGGFDSVNNMESVFLNPVGWLGGIAAVTSGAPWQVIVRASNIAAQGVPNVGEPAPGGSNTLNQDFALVVYNTFTNFPTLSDVPNLATNNSCSTAIILTQFPYTFTNTLTNSVYGHVQPSPSVARGGSEEFFKIPLPTAGTKFIVDTLGSDFDTVLSVWSVLVVPETVLVRGECGYLTEAYANDDVGGGILQSRLTFTADGSNDYYIVAEGKNGANGNLSLNVSRACTIVLSPSQLPSSRPGVVYGAQLIATGGQAPFTFAVSPTNGLPPGLALSPITGEMSGVPTQTGSFTFTISATDAVGCSGSNRYTVTIACPSLTLSPTLPSASVGQVYSNAITATGGQPPVTFTTAVGPLPPGLTLSANGVVSGVPTAKGIFSFKVNAVDTNGCFGTAFYTVSVVCPTLTISPTSLPAGTEFQLYSPVTLAATGGTPPYVFTQTGGSLPAGMTLTSAGVITGTPTSVSSVFTVTATDKNGCSANRTYTLTLADAPSTNTNTNLIVLTVGPPNLPAGVVGQSYNRMLTASGGIGTYAFAVTSGSLPTGLTLSPAGALTGTPTTEGQFNFTVTATDANGATGQNSYTVAITSEADLAVVSASLSPLTVITESNLTCTVTVTNLGPSPATGVTVANTLPSGVSLISASTGCTTNGSTLVCDIGNLAAGTGASVSYVITPHQAGTVAVTATVTADQTDANSANNQATANATVNAPYTVASNPKAITVDGDIVSVTLKGKGKAEVRLDNRGEISQIVLTGTVASSTLTIQVKKGSTGDGFVNIGSIIVSNGSLSAINGKAVNLTGAGIQVAGSLGSLTVNALSNTTVSVGGPIKSITAKSYSASAISAAKIGSVKLGTVTGDSGNQITVQQSGGTVSVTNPRSKWKITASSKPTDFQVNVVGP